MQTLKPEKTIRQQYLLQLQSVVVYGAIQRAIR